MKKRNRIALTVFLISLGLCPVYGAMRNPFARPAFLEQKPSESTAAKEKKPETTVANLSLTGIINGQIAIINHQFYRKGQKIGLLLVQEITNNKVVLEFQGLRYDLILNLSKIKKKE